MRATKVRTIQRRTRQLQAALWRTPELNEELRAFVESLALRAHLHCVDRGYPNLDPDEAVKRFLDAWRDDWQTA